MKVKTIDRRSILIGGISALFTATAFAHDTWQNGDPVPPWVKASCCGPEDVHHLTEDQVHLRDDGYHIDGYPDVIPTNAAIPSPDGSYWAFYKQFDSGIFSKVYCFFVPFSGI